MPQLAHPFPSAEPGRPAALGSIAALPLAARIVLAGIVAGGGACLVTGLTQLPTGQAPLVLGLLFLSALCAGVHPALLLLEGGTPFPLSYIVILAAVLLVGGWSTTPIAVVAAWSESTFRTDTRTRWYETLLRMGVMALAVVGSGGVYDAIGALLPAGVWGRWVSGAAAASAYVVIHTGLLGTVHDAFSRGTPRRPWGRTLKGSAPGYAAGAIAAVGIAELAAQGQLWWAGALALPLYLVYRSRLAYLSRIAEEQRQVRELSDVQLAMIEALALAIEAKDNTSQEQLRRMQVYCEGLARALGMSDAEVLGVRTAALLHDIGNLAVPEHILSKTGRLTYDERERLKLHPRVGAEIIRSVPFPYPVSELVRSHHERWDGRGYPAGLKGQDIALGARILAVADCFTSMLADRPYRPRRTYAEALATLRENGGSALDPALVERFIEVLPTIESRLHGVGAARGNAPAEGPDVPSSALADIAVAYREEQMLNDISHTLSASLLVGDTMALISSRLVMMMPIDSCALFLVDPASELFLCSHVTGDSRESIRALTASTVQRLDEMLPSVQSGPGGGPDQSRRLQSVMVCALETENGTIGALAVYHADPDAYTASHRRLLTRVATHAAKVIANAVIFEQTQEQSLTDVLTGLPNRRYFDRQLTQELGRVQRTGGHFSVLLLDMDGFKQINDEFGHQAGDQALREVAQTLRAGLRVYDLCARYAGDEFVVVLGECDAAQAERRRSEIQHAIAGLWVEPVPGYRVSLSVSAGAATVPDDADTVDLVIATADRRMYRDKGRRKRLESTHGTAADDSLR